MKTKISILLIYLFCLSCTKDPPLPSHDECDTTILYEVGDTLYGSPRFNPNNPNEIICMRNIQSTGELGLVKRNLSTGQETFIVNSSGYGMPGWSVKDWILFSYVGTQMWKIKSNGDSLTQIIVDPQHGGFEGIWNKTGDKIAYWTEISSGTGANTSYTTCTFITDASGNVMDTLFYPFQLNFGAAWSYDNTKIASYCYTYDVGYIDLSSKQMTKVTNNPQNDGYIINCIDWLPNSQDIIWSSRNGLFKTNITTKQTTLIKKTMCPKGGSYVAFSVSSDGKKIIASQGAHGMRLMNIDGTNEVVIK